MLWVHAHKLLIKHLLLGVLLTLYSNVSVADVSDTQKTEVVHLLHFLRSTSCNIDRNGKKYKGEEAYSLVLKKYKYLRDRIKTTEEFIEHSATKSTLSGEYYFVICGSEQSQRMQDWLLQELSTYRQPRRSDG